VLHQTHAVKFATQLALPALEALPTNVSPALQVHGLQLHHQVYADVFVMLLAQAVQDQALLSAMLVLILVNGFLDQLQILAEQSATQLVLHAQDQLHHNAKPAHPEHGLQAKLQAFVLKLATLLVSLAQDHQPINA
jgi:hypothetical protein